MIEKITFPQVGKNKDDTLALSRLIYGVWRLADDSDTSSAHIRSKIDACLEQGVTSFDHADIYGDYRCEALFGKALAEAPGLRDQMQLITKCGIGLLSDKYPNRPVKLYDTSASYIQNSLENSLRHLQTDYIDVLLIHRPNPVMDAAETGAALDALVDSGKVLSVGVSNFMAWDWRLLQQHMRHKLLFNQVEMSVLHSDPLVDGTLAQMQTDGIHAMSWSSLAGGRLFSEDADALRVKAVLEKFAQQFNRSIDNVALAWILAHPAKILPVFGSNNIERISKASQACDIQLDNEAWFEIYTAALGNEVA